MNPSESMPHCETLKDVQLYSSRRAISLGIYRQVDIRMRPKMPPVYAGHASVELSDGTHVLLEPSWSAAGIRRQEERISYDGKRVEVVGVVHSQTPKPPEPAAYVTGPCVSPVEDIRRAPEEYSP